MKTLIMLIVVLVLAALDEMERRAEARELAGSCEPPPGDGTVRP